jgi:Glycosyltransferase family 29 (sialyltransferase)
MNAGTCSIVGHGPSLLRRDDTGNHIDSADAIVRMKATGFQLMRDFPETAGRKVTHWGGSYTIREVVRRLSTVYDTPAWVWVDSRHEGMTIEDAGLVIDKPLCDEWDAKYRTLMEQHPLAGQHRHTSQGTKAILYACKLLQPREVVCYGFDNLKSGKPGWSLSRGREWTYPDHNWHAERELITDIERAFGVEIQFV